MTWNLMYSIKYYVILGPKSFKTKRACMNKHSQSHLAELYIFFTTADYKKYGSWNVALLGQGHSVVNEVQQCVHE